MNLLHRFRLAAWATLASTAALAMNASAQTPGLITGFEASGSPSEVTNPAGYTTGSLLFQDGWDLGAAGRSPRVQTAAEISAELTAAGLNVGQPVHSGDQALLVAKEGIAVEGSGYFVRDVFTGLETANNVVVDFWARPLTSGLGANPAGTPAGNDKTIGERQGNMFFGVSDANDGSQRTAAVRFGVDTVGADPYTNVTQRHIDFASSTAGAAVWVKSGLLWEADAWYNFRFEIDYTDKNYDFFVNGTQANGAPIPFYHLTANAAQRFFVSRGTNQAGSILDDLSITAGTASPDDPGDFNDDGLVDGADFLAWQIDNNIGSLDDWKAGMGSSLVAAGAVPEPSTVVLAVGMILVGACVRGRTWVSAAHIDAAV